MHSKPEGQHPASKANPFQLLLGGNANNNIRPKIYRPDDPRKIVTTFNVVRLEQILRMYGLLDARNKENLEFLRNGFPLGIASGWTLPKRIIHHNHGSALRHPEAIIKDIKKEEAAGRYSRAYEPDELERIIGPYFSAPMGVVDKDKWNPNGEKRVIHDDSFPFKGHERALNTHCISQSDQYSSTGFKLMCDFILNAPPGSKACVFDGKSAYRMCPLRREDQHLTCIYWDGKVRVDRAPHFGGVNAGVPHGRMADMLHQILKAKWPHLIPAKWQDDHVIIQTPVKTTGWANWLGIGSHDGMTISLGDIKRLLKEIGYPTKDEKDQEFSDHFTYVGFDWDMPNRSVTLTDKAKKSYLERVERLLAEKTASLEQINELRGQLIWCCSVIIDGKGYTRSFVKELEIRKGIPQTRQIRLEERTIIDLQWWRSALQDCTPRILQFQKPISDKWNVYVDASGWGCGVVINGCWDRWQLRDGWETNGRNIAWAEGVAIQLGIHILFRHYDLSPGTHVKIFSDNQGFTGGYNKGNSRNIFQNDVIVDIRRMLKERGCELTLEYIHTSQNPADKPSRGMDAAYGTRQSWSKDPLPSNLQGIFRSKEIPVKEPVVGQGLPPPLAPTKLHNITKVESEPTTRPVKSTGPTSTKTKADDIQPESSSRKRMAPSPNTEKKCEPPALMLDFCPSSPHVKGRKAITNGTSSNATRTGTIGKKDPSPGSNPQASAATSTKKIGTPSLMLDFGVPLSDAKPAAAARPSHEGRRTFGGQGGASSPRTAPKAASGAAESNLPPSKYASANATSVRHLSSNSPANSCHARSLAFEAIVPLVRGALNPQVGAGQQSVRKETTTTTTNRPRESSGVSNIRRGSPNGARAHQVEPKPPRLSLWVA